MAKGPPPTPTALKLVRGNPGRRPLNDAEPVITGPVQKPRHLTGRAGDIWSRFAPPLVRAGVLTTVDIYMMSLWCQLAEEIETRGVPQMNFRMLAQFRAISGELGLTPASRGRIRVNKPSTGGNPLDRFFSKV